MVNGFELNSSEDLVINALELTSINALVAYKAYEKKTSEEVVRHVFSDHFGINSLDKLPKDSFDRAIRFLVDVQLHTVN